MEIVDRQIDYYVGNLTADEFREFNDWLIEEYGAGVHDTVEHWLCSKYPTKFPYVHIAGSKRYFAGNDVPKYYDNVINAEEVLNPIWIQ